MFISGNSFPLEYVYIFRVLVLLHAWHQLELLLLQESVLQNSPIHGYFIIFDDILWLFSLKANFIIQLEKSVNNIPYLRMKEDKFHIDFPQRKQNLYQKVMGLLYFGSEMDAVDGEENEHEYEYEMEITLEDHIEKAIELKLENFRSSLRDELKVIHDQIKEDRKHLEEKMEMILEKLK